MSHADVTLHSTPNYGMEDEFQFDNHFMSATVVASSFLEELNCLHCYVYADRLLSLLK